MTRNTRITAGWMAASLATLSLGLAVGCGNKDGGGAGSGGGGGSDLAMLPADAEIIAAINVTQLTTSPLYKKYVEPLMLKDDVKVGLADFKTKCGFDPTTAITSVTLGLKVGPNGAPEGNVVVHGLDKAKVAPCLDKYKAEMEKDGVTVKSEGDVLLITGKQGVPVAIAWANATTLVAVSGANGTAAGAKAAAEGKGALAGSAKFKELTSKLKQSDSVWAIIKGTIPGLGMLKQMANPNYLYGSVNVTDGVTAGIGMELENADKAKQITDMAMGQISQAKSMFDKLEVKQDGAHVKVDLALSTAKLEALMQQMAPFLGGM
jgi:hypothetical protein